MNLLKEILQSSRKKEALEVVAGILGVSRLELSLRQELVLNSEQEALFFKRWERLLAGEPLAYIEGTVSFFGRDFLVDSRVLIPRQETELLVELVLKLVNRKKLKVLDLCSGSGCIGITLKKERPDWEVILSDLSEEALEVSKENAKQLDVDVRFLQGDFLSPLDELVDVVVCNPPYVSEREYEELDPSVKNFEPKMALFSEEEGGRFYRRLSEDLPACVTKGAQVFLEIGYRLGDVVGEIFSAPCWREKKLLFDLAQNPRFFFLEMQSNSLYPG